MFARLLVLFITVPFIELVLLLEIGGRIGVAATVLVILATGALGAWLTRSQGLQVLARFRQATSEGRLPHREVVEGLMILIAGAVLLTPGFLTDTVGFLLLIPPVRAIVRDRLIAKLKGRFQVMDIAVGPPGSSPAGGGRPREKRVEGRVIDD